MGSTTNRRAIDKSRHLFNRIEGTVARREPGPRSGWAGRVLRRPVLPTVAVAFVMAAAGTAAANGWVQDFRTSEIAPLSVSTADFVALPDLEDFGEVVVESGIEVRSVPDAVVAAAETGLEVPEVVDLPRGVSGEPRYDVVGEASATFRFSTERATQNAAEAGATLPAPPTGLDGSQVELHVGPGFAASWSADGRPPSMVIGRVVAPTAVSSGVSFAAARDYLVSIPGFPSRVADQLRTFSGDGSTLPLPIPTDRIVAEQTQVNGVSATLMATLDGAFTAVIWVDAGVLNVVAGSLDDDEVLSIASQVP